MCVPIGRPKLLERVTLTSNAITVMLVALTELTGPTCSLTVTVPMPASVILVLGAGVAVIGVPPITRLVKVEPLVLVAVVVVAMLLATDCTAVAVIAPPSRLKPWTVALDWTEALVPNSEVVTVSLAAPLLRNEPSAAKLPEAVAVWEDKTQLRPTGKSGPTLSTPEPACVCK